VHGQDRVTEAYKTDVERLPLDGITGCNYCNHMKAKVIRIGNSRGIRIPQKVLEHYHIKEGAALELEERRDGILIRPLETNLAKVSWEQAYRQMAAEAAEGSEWAEWDAVSGDGVDG
jgi:antitoxin MazE